MTSVRVNVFDLTGLNVVLRCARIGVYHSSIVINDSAEYYYGYAMPGCTGIDSPEIIDELPSIMNGRRYATVDMGESNLDPLECQRIVNNFKLSERYMSEHYNLLFHNCNTFTYEMRLALLGKKQTNKKYPHWIRRGQGIAAFVFSISLAQFLALARNFTLPGFSILDHGKKVGSEEKERKHTAETDIEEVELEDE